MKLVVVAVAAAFLSAVAADVSHLNNAYLPPVHSTLPQKQPIPYVHESQRNLAASEQEVVDNSLVENVSAVEQKPQNVDNQLLAESFSFHDHVQNHAAKSQLDAASNYFGAATNGNVHPAGAIGQHVQNAVALGQEVEAHVQDKPVGATSETQNGNGQCNGGGHLCGDSFGQFYANGVPAQQAQNPATLAHQANAHVQQAVAVKVEEPAVPVPEIYQPTQKPANYYTQAHQQNERPETHIEEQQKQYYTGATAQQHAEISAGIAVPQQVQQQNHNVGQHTAAFVAQSNKVTGAVPAIQGFVQSNYGQQTDTVNSKAATGVYTQYGANGGYVY